MHDTLTPLGGMIPLLHMMLNVVFGGKGVGLMNMIMYAILAAVSYTHLDVYKRQDPVFRSELLQEIDHVVRNDDDIEKALDLVDREVLIKLLGIEQEICSQCRAIWKKMQKRRLERG